MFAPSMLMLLLAIALLTRNVLSCDLKDPILSEWARKRVEALGNCTALSAGSKPVEYKIPSVKLILYHCDEHEMLADFLQYHSYVFGFENLVVIDQDSQMEPVCKTLALFKHCGTDVITTHDSFLKKGVTLTKIMHRHKHTLLIPIDVDELIFPFAPGSQKVTVDRDELWSAFKELPVDGRKYKFQFYTQTIPRNVTCERTLTTQNEEYRRVVSNNHYYPLYPPGPRSKTFFHSHGFISTDDGNHNGLVKNDKEKPGDYRTNMSDFFIILRAQMVHFSLGSYRGSKDKYVRASSHMGFTGDTNCSIERVGGQYCAPCKLFVNGTDHGAKFYMDSCRTISNAYSFPIISNWFKKNTMSMMQLAESRDLEGTPL